eukprot:g7986.t1
MPPPVSTKSKVRRRRGSSAQLNPVRFLTGEYDDGTITQEFKLAKRRSTLLPLTPKLSSSSISSLNESSSEEDIARRRSGIAERANRKRKQKSEPLDAWTNFLIQFRILSGKSSARDKVMAFAQSFCVFRQGILGKSNVPHVYLYFRTFEDWIKDTRKGFKLFKWIVEVEKTRSAYTTISDVIIRWLEVTMHIVAMGYHFVDNRIFINKVIYRVETLTSDDLLVRYGPKSVPGEKEFLGSLKRQKNQFSLIRCFLSIICESRWVLTLTEDIRLHMLKKSAYLKQLGHSGEDGTLLAGMDEYESRLRAIRKFHFLMLIRVICYFIMTSSKRGHLFGFSIPFIGQTLDGIFGMIGAGIAVWKNLPTVVKG